MVNEVSIDAPYSRDACDHAPMRPPDHLSSVTGHFDHPYNRPWKHVDRPLTPLLAKLFGAKDEEIAHTSTLTSNMHNLFISFYRPTKRRWKIVIEQGSFPSDWVSSVGLNPLSRGMWSAAADIPSTPCIPIPSSTRLSSRPSRSRRPSSRSSPARGRRPCGRRISYVFWRRTGMR